MCTRDIFPFIKSLNLLFFFKSRNKTLSDLIPFHCILALILLIYCIRSLIYFPINWHIHNYTSKISLFICLFVIILQIIVYKKVFTQYLFLLIIYPLSTKYNYTVEDYLVQITTFWIFISYVCKFNTKDALLLIHINLSQSLLSAGIDKCIDPTWVNGTGLYYVANLPWISYPKFNIFNEFNISCVIMNYSAILFECTYFLLLIIPKTRFVASLFSTIFFGYLFIILRIDFIGPVGLLISISFLLCSKNTTNYYNYFNFKARRIKIVISSLYLLMGLYTSQQILTILFSRLPRDNSIYLTKPLGLYSSTLINKLRIPLGDKYFSYLYHILYINKNQFSKVTNTLFNISDLTINFADFRLFSVRHFYPLYTYQLEVTDNIKVYRLPVFKIDQSPDKLSGSLFMPRCFQTKMYLFSKLANTSTTTLNDRMQIELSQFLDYAVKQSKFKGSLNCSVYIKPIEFKDPFNPLSYIIAPDEYLLAERYGDNQINLMQISHTHKQLSINSKCRLYHERFQ